MDNDNAEWLLNKVSTDPPPNTYEMDCLSTQTEKFENESVKSNAHTSNPNQTCVSKNPNYY